VVGVDLFGHYIFRLPKLLYFGKFFMVVSLHISIFRIKVCIFVLCVHFVKRTRNLFNIYFLNVLMFCIFGVEFDKFFLLHHFSNKDDLFYFIQSDGSPLVKLIKLAMITFSIWMIWRIMNYARF